MSCSSGVSAAAAICRRPPTAIHCCCSSLYSPLKGTGIPRLETTEVYISAYLDRLLAGEWAMAGCMQAPAATALVLARLTLRPPSASLPAVDEDNYRFEAVYYMFNSWRDISAYETIYSEQAKLLLVVAPDPLRCTDQLAPEWCLPSHQRASCRCALNPQPPAPQTTRCAWRPNQALHANFSAATLWRG